LQGAPAGSRRPKCGQKNLGDGPVIDRNGYYISIQDDGEVIW
jgi:hypothetical protein